VVNLGIAVDCRPLLLEHGARFGTREQANMDWDKDGAPRFLGRFVLQIESTANDSRTGIQHDLAESGATEYEWNNDVFQCTCCSTSLSALRIESIKRDSRMNT
jgi:hypothetical protein